MPDSARARRALRLLAREFKTTDWRMFKAIRYFLYECADEADEAAARGMR